MTNVIELAKQVHLIDNSGACAFVEGTNLIPYIERFATLVRNAALDEAAQQTGEFAQAWWSKHCASNKHMETTRAAHDDFCRLQINIRNLKEPTP